eukprot:6488561-Amphidinium_carterae.2
MVMEVPKPKEPPSQDEIERHMLTHLPPQPDWCLSCALARTPDADHKRRLWTVEAEPPRMQFDICYLKADGHRIMPGDTTSQPWATTFCGVDEATQTPMAIALEQKGGASTDYIVQSTI